MSSFTLFLYREVEDVGDEAENPAHQEGGQMVLFGGGDRNGIVWISDSSTSDDDEIVLVRETPLVNTEAVEFERMEILENIEHLPEVDVEMVQLLESFDIATLRDAARFLLTPRVRLVDNQTTAAIVPMRKESPIASDSRRERMEMLDRLENLAIMDQDLLDELRRMSNFEESITRANDIIEEDRARFGERPATEPLADDMVDKEKEVIRGNKTSTLKRQGEIAPEVEPRPSKKTRANAPEMSTKQTVGGMLPGLEAYESSDEDEP